MKNEIIARFLEFHAGGDELPDLNRILLIIRDEKLSLFQVFVPSFPKTFAVTSFYKLC